MTKTGSQDPSNYTSVTLYDVHAVNDAFWVLGFSSVARNGTSLERTWAVRIDAQDRSVDTWELHREEGPVVTYPQEPGDRASHPFIQRSVASGDRLFVVTSWMGWVANETGDPVPGPGPGGLFLTRLLTSGGVDYSVRLDSAFRDGWPIVPALAAWRGTPRVVGVLLGPPGPYGTQSLLMYDPNSTGSDVNRRILILSQRKAYLLYWSLDTERNGAFGAGPHTSVFPGTTLLEDAGLLDWRAHVGGPDPTREMVEAPYILRINGETGSTELVVLVRPPPRPDAFAGLLASAALAGAAVLALVVGYPRWRLRRARKELDKE